MVTVKDIMTTPVITVSHNENILKVVSKLNTFNISCVVVVKDTEPVGIITEKDLVQRVIHAQANPNKLSASEVMSKPIKTIEEDKNLIFAISFMKTEHIKQLPVVSNNRLVGMLTQTDVIKVMNELIKS